jgi:biotin-dependent carboxylase-like uncharacterized protein
LLTSAALLVIKPGLQTTVQDGGRWGYQAMGVPTSGALDGDALVLANALVGNPPNAAALEIRHSGPTMRVQGEAIIVALADATARLTVRVAEKASHYPPWHAVSVPPGAEFGVCGPTAWASALLAIAGGIDVPAVFGSRATHLRSKMGGHEGRALQTGDTLRLAPRDTGALPLMLPAPPKFHREPRLRVVLGPQDDWFTDEAIGALLENPFTVTQDADRMGLRLAGHELPHRESFDLPSDGIVTGAVQVPGSRQPIVLLADHQTTGGYPKIATVISADLARLGRLVPGDRLWFRPVQAREAEALARQHSVWLARLVGSMVPAVPPAMLNEEALSRANLISGVVHADPNGAVDET